METIWRLYGDYMETIWRVTWNFTYSLLEQFFSGTLTLKYLNIKCTLQHWVPLPPPLFYRQLPCFVKQFVMFSRWFRIIKRSNWSVRRIFSAWKWFCTRIWTPGEYIILGFTQTLHDTVIFSRQESEYRYLQ